MDHTHRTTRQVSAFSCILQPHHNPQSERLDLYHTYARRLLDVRLRIPVLADLHRYSFFVKSGHAYRCFCSPETLASIREKLARVGSNATYDKTCLSLSDEEVSRKVRAGEKSIVRLNVSSSIPSFKM